VAVDVGGEAYVGVSQKVLHKPGVYTLPQQERGARMPQVVEAGLLGQFCTLEQSLEGAIQVAARDGRADGGGKPQT
jgi:hypothetical protein